MTYCSQLGGAASIATSFVFECWAHAEGLVVKFRKLFRFVLSGKEAQAKINIETKVFA